MSRSQRRVAPIATNRSNLLPKFVRFFWEMTFAEFLKFVVTYLLPPLTGVLTLLFPYGLFLLAAIASVAIPIAVITYACVSTRTSPKAWQFAVISLFLAFLVVTTRQSAENISRLGKLKKLQHDFHMAALKYQRSGAAGSNEIRHLSDLLKQIAELSHSAAGEVRVELYAHDPVRDVLVGMPCCSTSMHPVSQSREFDVSQRASRYGRGVAGYVFEFCCIKLIDDASALSADDECQFKHFGDEQDVENGKSNSLVAIPVCLESAVDGRVKVGVVCLCSQAPGLFNTDDLTVLQEFATAVAPAFERHVAARRMAGTAKTQTESR